MKRSRSSSPTRLSRRPHRNRESARILACLVACTGVAASAASAQEPPPAPIADREPAAECCLVLLLPVGARAIALGRALSAASTPDAVFANPAGLAALESDHFIIHRTTIAAEATALSLLFAPHRIGTIGLSYQLLDFGEIENTDAQGRTIGAITLRHHVLIASYATPIAGGLAAGLNYKLYQFRIGCRGQCEDGTVSATTHAIDVGARYRPGLLPALELGAAISNLGFPLQVVNAQQADPLPLRVRMGARYEVLHHFRPDSALLLWWAVELEDHWNAPGSPTVSTGLELAVRDVIFLRAGYVPGDGIDTGVAVGIGIHYERFSVAVAKSFVTGLVDVTEPVQVSFGLRF